jgi:putative restriction endonuclease
MWDMSYGVFIHRPDSRYDDVPSERYQFPKQYLDRARQFEGGWVLYLEPSKLRETRGYFAVARVDQIIPDPRHDGMFLAIISPGSYLDFGTPVPFREDGTLHEAGLLNERGVLSGRAQAAVRPVSPTDFARIVRRGLEEGDDILPRIGSHEQTDGFAEPQAVFETPDPRRLVEALVNRKLRDRNFRKTVLRAYGERCAITGLRLINGGGRAEVEAAHIRPVERDGPDDVRNGLALSGTVHWMFDRGLIGLSDDLDVMVSRQLNDARAVQAMINSSGRLIPPVRGADRPHPVFLDWHRRHCFKH